MNFSQTPNAPVLVPSDYLVARPVKEALRGGRFATDDEVKDTVFMWLRSQLKAFFADGIRRLVYRYVIYIVNIGAIILRNDTL